MTQPSSLASRATPRRAPGTSRRWPAVAAALLLLPALAARAQCTPISFVPNIISSSGVYCVTANLSYVTVHAPAISITASAVVLDFQGHRLQWNGSTTSGHAAVSVQPGLANVVVRNGLISGFTTGVETYAAGSVVEDMRMNNNGLGIFVRFGSEGSIVRRNYIRLGNGIRVEGSSPGYPPAETGSVRIIDNDIYGPSTPDGRGYNAIDIQSKSAVVVGNRMGRVATCIWFDPLTQATGKYRDNICVNVITAYNGGTDAGNND